MLEGTPARRPCPHNITRPAHTAAQVQGASARRPCAHNMLRAAHTVAQLQGASARRPCAHKILRTTHTAAHVQGTSAPSPLQSQSTAHRPYNGPGTRYFRWPPVRSQHAVSQLQHTSARGPCARAMRHPDAKQLPMVAALALAAYRAHAIQRPGARYLRLLNLCSQRTAHTHTHTAHAPVAWEHACALAYEHTFTYKR